MESTLAKRPAATRFALLAKVIFAIACLGLSIAQAQDIDSSIGKLTGGLTPGISKSGIKKISVIDFTDLDGHGSQLGRFIAEQLSVALVNSAKDFAVLDRANMQSILEEHKLTASGLVNPDNARKLGQFAGVDAIVLGNITLFGRSYVVTAKAISTETTQVLAATSVNIPRSNDLDIMALPPTPPEPEKAVIAPPAPPPPPAKDFSAPNSAFVFGRIGVELESFRMIQGGILATLKIENRQRQLPERVGFNMDSGGRAIVSVVDDTGNVYRAQGINGTGVGYLDGMLRNLQYYNFAGNPDGLQGWLNKMTQIEPGESALVTLTLRPDYMRASGSQFEMHADLVEAVGAGERCRVSGHSLFIPGIRPN